MSTYTQAYADVRINDDTRFRTQGKFISDSLESAGWAKQADTGQIDWTTVAKPTAANTMMGYEIRKSTDAKTDLYLKIEYGSGPSYAYAFGFKLTAGLSTDGAGVVTNILLPQTGNIGSAMGYSGGSARAGDYFVSGDTGRLMVGLQDDTNATYGVGFLLQRRTNASGVDQEKGWRVVMWGNNCLGVAQSCNIREIAYGDDSTPVNAAETIQTLRVQRCVGDASHVNVFPIVWQDLELGMLQLRDAVVIPTAQAAMLSTHALTILGTSHTYVALWSTTASGSWGYTAPAALSLCVRYD